ncbi:MAG: OmpA family protein [Boseongicola sp.]|nr:OmpA family protein [Boseongicola sp.]NNJ68332.1 OmpA family protein [Boseongicola sp.]
MIRNAFFVLLIATTPAVALDLSVPGGVETSREVSPATSVRLPTSAWSRDTGPPVVEGAIRKRTVRIGGGGQTTLQLLAPLRQELLDAGYTEVFSCQALTCGGFDFRFQLDLLGEPDMHVDLGDFRYLLMQTEQEDPQSANQISLVVSRDAQAGYIHITEVFPKSLPPTDAPFVRPAQTTSVPGTLPSTLENAGHVILDDLDFGSGASDLGTGRFQSLNDLAMWLGANPTITVAIVGHTDAVGSLAGNTALSKRRAESVRARLVEDYGVAPQQMQADGVGYLAPIASNLTEEGRSANRRVEVIVLTD